MANETGPRQIEQPRLPKTEWYDLAEIDAALKDEFRRLMLEHARLGRSVHQSRDGKVVEVTPAEIFARYGLDENGKPLSITSSEKQNSPSPPTPLPAGREIALTPQPPLPGGEGE
jgi:hypothetical protein